MRQTLSDQSKEQARYNVVLENLDKTLTTLDKKIDKFLDEYKSDEKEREEQFRESSQRRLDQARADVDLARTEKQRQWDNFFKWTGITLTGSGVLSGVVFGILRLLN